MTPLHLAWASAVTFGELSWAPARASISQTVVRPENSYARPTFYHCQDAFCMQEISFTSAAPAPLLSFLPSFLFSPPSILLTTCPASAEIECEVSHFCHQDKGLWVCVGRVHARWRPTPETCGVFKPAGPPISPPPVTLSLRSSGVHLLSVLASAFPNPHKDLSLCHKFIESTNQTEHILC